MAGGGRRRERRRLHQGLRHLRVPGPDRRGGEGLRRLVRRAAEGSEADGPQRAAGGRCGTGGVAGQRVERRRPGAGRHRRRLGDRRAARDRRPAQRPARARARPNLPVLHPERARRLRERPDRDLPRPARAQLRAGVGVRDRLPRRRRGRRADPSRRRRRGARGRDRVVHPPAHPGRLLRDARPRCRGRGARQGLAPVRRHPRRLRDGRGRVHPAARGARTPPRRAGRRSTRRCSATALRTTHITWRSRTRTRSGSAR